MVGELGFSTTAALSEGQFEQVVSHVNSELAATEQLVEEKDKNLKQLYSFDRFGGDF